MRFIQMFVFFVGEACIREAVAAAGGGRHRNAILEKGRRPVAVSKAFSSETVDSETSPSGHEEIWNQIEEPLAGSMKAANVRSSQDRLLFANKSKIGEALNRLFSFFAPPTFTPSSRNEAEFLEMKGRLWSDIRRNYHFFSLNAAEVVETVAETWKRDQGIASRAIETVNNVITAVVLDIVQMVESRRYGKLNSRLCQILSAITAVILHNAIATNTGGRFDGLIGLLAADINGTGLKLDTLIPWSHKLLAQAASAKYYFTGGEYTGF